MSAVADTYIVQGTIECDPNAGGSVDIGDLGQIDERLLVAQKLNVRFDLTSDAAFAVPMLNAGGGPFKVGANVLVVKPQGGKVRVRITSSDGSSQSVPVDSYLHLISLSVPITAVDFTRLSGTLTTVKLFMAEKF